MHPERTVTGFAWLHAPEARQPLSPAWHRFVTRQTLGESSPADPQAFAIWYERLPPEVPAPLGPALFEAMAWALVSRPHCDAIVFPLSVSLAPAGGAIVLPCAREALALAMERGFIGICRPRAAGILRVCAPSAAPDLVVEASSRPLLDETLALLPAVVLVRPPRLQRVADAVRRRVPRVAWHWLSRWYHRLRLLHDPGASHPEQPLAVRRAWEPPFPRPEIVVRRAPTDDRVPVWIAMHWLELGGAEKFALDLVRALPKDRFAIHVTTDLPSANPWAAMIRNEVEEVVHLPEFLPHHMFGVFAEHFIRTRGIRLLHINHAPRVYESLFHLRRFAHPLRVMHTLHILELPPHSGGYPEWSMTNFGVFIDHHHVISEQLKRFLMQRWLVPEERIDVVRIDVDTAWFDPARVPPGGIRHARGIPDDAVVVGFVGRFAVQKRPLEFVRLATLLTRQWQRSGGTAALHFVMAGDGPLRPQVRAAVRKAGLGDVVHLVGELHDTRSVYRDCDAIAMASENEGLALVTYEAMAMATPIFFTDVGAQKELLEPGQLVPSGDDVAPALADRLWPYLLDPERRRALGERQRAYVVARHCSRESMTRMIALYDRLTAAAAVDAGRPGTAPASGRLARVVSPPPGRVQAGGA